MLTPYSKLRPYLTISFVHSDVSGNSLRTLTAFCLVTRFLFLTTGGASWLDRSCAKFGLGHTPGGAHIKGESATHYTRMYFTLKNLWLMKYHLISGIFSCKYTRRYLIFDLMAFSFSSLTALNSPHYCMRRFFLIIVFFFTHLVYTVLVTHFNPFVFILMWCSVQTLSTFFIYFKTFTLCFHIKFQEPSTVNFSPVI